MSAQLMLPILFVSAMMVVLFFAPQLKKLTSTLHTRSRSYKQSLNQTPEQISFGYNCIWIAVKTTQKEKVARILGLEKMEPCGWKEGIENAYQDKVFIGPPVGDWTMIIGRGLVDPAAKTELDEVAGHKAKIDALSKEFGEAQLFLTIRSIEYHSWARSLNGTTVRYYSYLGEMGEHILIEGDATPIENQLKVVDQIPMNAETEGYFESEDITVPDEDTVMMIAKAWSINPSNGFPFHQNDMGLLSR